MTRLSYTPEQAAMALRAFDQTGNVREASRLSGISYDAAWKFIRKQRTTGSFQRTLRRLPVAVVERYNAGETMRVLGAEFSISIASLAKFLRHHGASLRSVSEVNELWWSDRCAIPRSFSFLPLRPDTVWLLGLLTGDGCVKTRGQFTLAVSDNDADVIDKVRTIVGGISFIEQRRSACLVPVFCSVRLVRELLALGILPNKTRNLAWPKLPDTLLPHFVRGLCDSDGGWVRNNRTLRFAYKSATASFLYTLDSELRRLGVIRDVRHVYCYSSKRDGWADSNAFITVGHDSCHLGAWMYGNDCTDSNRCARKYLKWKNWNPSR